jgi:serine/threonine protein kinase
MTNSDNTQLSPETLLKARYRIQDTLGKGGMGVVYKAYDNHTKQHVAVKQVLVPGDAAHTKQAFEREAHLLRQLDHPHLPRVIDSFVHVQGKFLLFLKRLVHRQRGIIPADNKQGNFLVMSFVEGHNLAYLLGRQRRPFTKDEVQEFARILLGLLHYLHTRTPPVLHRDIKPDNLMLTNDEKLYLVDFGLAVERTHGQQTTGRTRYYAPPEQIAGATVNDPRSDFYALGATLYTLLTEDFPTDSWDRQQALDAGHPDPLRSARMINPQVPADLSDALSRMMALNIDERPATIAEMQPMFNLPGTKPQKQAVSTTPQRIPDASPAEPAVSTPSNRLIPIMGIVGAIVIFIMLAIAGASLVLPSTAIVPAQPTAAPTTVANTAQPTAAPPTVANTVQPTLPPSAVASYGFVPDVERHYPNIAHSDQHNSCIRGLVSDGQDNDVTGQIIVLSSLDSNVNPEVVNASGGYYICGLSAGEWYVIFTSGNTPHVSGTQSVTATVNLGGAPDQIAVVNFYRE